MNDVLGLGFVKTIGTVGCMGLLLLGWLSATAAAKDKHRTWTDPEVAAREDADFAIQGEYRTAATEPATGAQVVALGNGRFDVYILDGGLPGEGWEPGKSRIALSGQREDQVVRCADETGRHSATIRQGQLVFRSADDGAEHHLVRAQRRSPTLGSAPPDGGVVLFDGTSVDGWENAKLANQHLLASGCTTLRHFGDFKLHLEFRTPYKPTARGQQRGNSGVYCGGRWETQILDSFGREARDNECGGIYSIAAPRLNMCLPPLVWQTYDIEFTAAKFDAAGVRTSWPRATVRLNGVLVHENVELAKEFTTSAPLSGPLDHAAGPIFLQDHGNPVVFRNLWIVPGP